MYLSAGQTSDYTGAAGLLSALPSAKYLLADRGYDADWFRNALIDKNITPCIPSKKNRKVQIPHDADLYKKTPQNRKHVWPDEGLAQDRHAL